MELIQLAIATAIIALICCLICIVLVLVWYGMQNKELYKYQWKIGIFTVGMFVAALEITGFLIMSLFIH